MLDAQKHKIAGKIAPELFLKQTLSEPYEMIESCRIFHISDMVSIREIMKSVDVDYCKTVDEFKNKLEQGKPNLLINTNLINSILLKEIVSASSQTKNILLGDLVNE